MYAFADLSVKVAFFGNQMTSWLLVPKCTSLEGHGWVTSASFRANISLNEAEHPRSANPRALHIKSLGFDPCFALKKPYSFRSKIEVWGWSGVSEAGR